MLVDLFAQPLLPIAHAGLGLDELLEFFERVGHALILEDLALWLDSVSGLVAQKTVWRHGIDLVA